MGKSFIDNIEFIIMTKTVKLFLPNEFHEELLYQYEDKDADLRKVVFGLLKPLAKQGKMTKLSGSLQCRIMKGKDMAMEERDLKEIDIEKLAPKSDDKWIPEKVTADEIKIYSLTVSDRLYEDLWYFGKLFTVRLDIWNNTLDSKADDYETQKAILPACFEQIIQDNVVGALSRTISEGIEKDYDEEFAEMDKKEKPNKAEGPATPPKAGERPAPNPKK